MDLLPTQFLRQVCREEKTLGFAGGCHPDKSAFRVAQATNGLRDSISQDETCPSCSPASGTKVTGSRLVE